MELVANSAARRSTVGRQLRKDTRSAVTNGQRLHVERPGNTAWARRFRDVLEQIIADLHTNNETLSEGQRQLARRAATLCITCEKLEGKAAADEDIDLELFGTLTDRLGRTFHRLGLKRTASKVPSLGEYLKTITPSKET
jgi:hypothetical protein